MAMATRIYLVSNGQIEAAHRLIEATSQAQALRFAADRHFTTTVADPKTVRDMMKSGADVEDATRAPTA
jgi:hypothetical protein